MVSLPIGFALPSKIIQDGQIFHMAMAVPDLARAMDELGQALSLSWTRVRDIDMQLSSPTGEDLETPIRAVYSLQGPPYLELVTGQPGSMFSVVEGPRLHHVGLMVEDIDTEVQRLQGLGMRLLATTPGPGVAFVTNDFGLNLEIMGQRVRGVLDDWLFGKSENA